MNNINGGGRAEEKHVANDDHRQILVFISLESLYEQLLVLHNSCKTA